MNIAVSTALVTGANRGLGAHLINELLAAGAKKIYAGARDPQNISRDVLTNPRIQPLRLHITDPVSIAAAAKEAGDVNLLINNAGVLGWGGVLDGDLDVFQRDLATNYFGTLQVTRAFVPHLEANGPSAIANVLTLIALAPVSGMAGYSASKAAAHSMTQSLRADLKDRGIEVIGAYPGGMDTDMLAGVEAVKAPPALVAQRIIAGIAESAQVIWPDDVSAGAGSVYVSDPLQLERMLAG